MIVHDPGHLYELDILDGDKHTPKPLLRFVKRKGEKYPGNKNAYPGTNMQEVLRALINRAEYVNTQEPDLLNFVAIEHMRRAIHAFETRAALRHGREAGREVLSIAEAVNGKTCSICGHVGLPHKGCAKRKGKR